MASLRKLVIGLAFAVAWPWAAAGQDLPFGPTCGEPDGAGVRLCVVGLADDAMDRMLATQRKPSWCWAASIAMVFGQQGLDVSQDEIVQRALGTVADRPADGPTISALLRARWPASGGGEMHGQARVGDRIGGESGLPEAAVREELAAGRPLILGAGSHAVVLARLTYEEFTREGAWRVIQGTAVDPAPGAGVRPLRKVELRPTYLAAVRLVSTSPGADRH